MYVCMCYNIFQSKCLFYGCSVIKYKSSDFDKKKLQKIGYIDAQLVNIIFIVAYSKINNLILAKM